MIGGDDRATASAPSPGRLHASTRRGGKRCQGFGTGGRRPLLIGCGLLGCGLLSGWLLGCSPSRSTSDIASPPQDESQRPPLVVWLVDAPELAEPIEQLWLATSSQSIRVEVVDGASYLQRAECPADVILAPALDLAELADREWISPLPQSLARLAGGPPGSSASRRSPAANGAASGERWDDLGDTSSGAWPEAWQNAASYGRRMWGVPLSLPVWTLVIGQPPSGQDQPTPEEETSSPADAGEWTSSWLKLPVGPEPSEADQARVATGTDVDWLVERFLALLSQQTTRPEPLGVLLDISDAQPRLDDPTVIKAAETLIASIRQSPLPLGETSAWLAPPDQAWRAVADGSIPWALAWPAPQLEFIPAGSETDPEPLDAGDVLLRVRRLPSPSRDTPAEAAPVAAGQTIVASIGFRTRQSAVAGFFLEWLNEPGQRRSLSRHSWRISPLPDASLEAGASMERLEYRQFAALSWQANKLRPELQLNGARQYRQLLGEALLVGFDDPERLPAALQQCARQWRQLTEQLGVSKQRRSYERSLGLRS